MMGSIIDPVESVVSSNFSISVISDIPNTSTSTSASDTTTITASSTQAISTATISSQNSMSASTSNPSSTQASTASAKTSKSKGSTISSSASQTTTSTITSISSTQSITSTSTPTPTSISSSTTELSSPSDTASASSTSSTDTLSISSTSSTSFMSTTLSTSTTMTPISSTTVPSANTAVSPKPTANASDGPQSHLPAIIVASVMGAFVLGTILYLIFKYYPPIQSRWEAYKEKKNGTGAYRDTARTESSPSLEKQTNKDRRSYLVRNWYWNGTQTPGQEDHTSGLGLGRVSMLREQALADTQETPPPRAFTNRHTIGQALG